ncbi:hypothetical protein [Cardiobacterium hominis]|jgi:hypothetical protein|uniref:hypothetical protein n=1 Tax=Cardiobacterium hominis TaxID=2718 RepID=UPI002492D6F4|nr:hypothetical protein [Cardiobacterium hominis]
MSLTASEIRALADRQWCVLPGTQDETVSELRILQSAAGYYVGRVEITEEGYEFPYCRESGYYPTREKAESALAFLRELEREPE